MTRKPKQFKGTGRTFDEALQQAINEAGKTIKFPDGAVQWKLVELRGQVGGILGKPLFYVTIESQ